MAKNLKQKDGDPISAHSALIWPVAPFFRQPIILKAKKHVATGGSLESMQEALNYFDNEFVKSNDLN